LYSISMSKLEILFKRCKKYEIIMLGRRALTCCVLITNKQGIELSTRKNRWDLVKRAVVWLLVIEAFTNFNRYSIASK
jgi:hypothetical protein